MTEDATVQETEAQTLREAAKHHKRLSQHHRRKAQALMAQLAKLGINLETNDKAPKEA